jgi:hypothetical protein
MEPTIPTSIKHPNNCIDDDVRGAVSRNNLVLTEALLPRHIIVDSILAFLDLHSLVVFSGCSRTFHNLVFMHSPKDRWETIYLCGGKPCSINDDQLSAFLRNINAVENTRVLSLVGCPSLTCRGIELLAGSTVLEDIDLRVRGTLPLKGLNGKRYGVSSIDGLCVTRVLRTMLPRPSDQDIAPFNLRRVAFRPIVPSTNTSGNGYENDVARFMSHLNSCKRILAIKSKAMQCNNQEDCLDIFGKCSKCMEILHEEIVKCSSCTELLCSVCKEEHSIKCIVCKFNYCTPCAMPPKCSICKVQKCQWCSNIYECGGCGKQSCANHGAECCSECETSYCSNCKDEYIEFCIVCNQHHCSDGCHDRMHR